jgi:hypothetical protein
MIRWPSESVLTPAAQANLERFKVTAAARELERDPRVWTLAEWSWTQEPEMHVLLRNESLAEILFSFDESGTWRLQQGQQHFVREALDEPADAVEAEAVLEGSRLSERLRRALRHHPERRIS